MVPASLSDPQLEGAAKYRVGGRLPTLVARWHYMINHKPTMLNFNQSNFILFQFRHKGVPLVRASGPLVPGRRNNDDEKAVAAVLGGRKRGFILDVQVMNSTTK